jgi:hypothetical protein
MLPIDEQLVRARINEMYEEAEHRARIKELRSGTKWQRRGLKRH